MVYTPEQKEELDAILKAFENYIDEQNYFDIIYSKKIGYVWIVVDKPGAAGTEELDTPEAMLALPEVPPQRYWLTEQAAASGAEVRDSTSAISCEEQPGSISVTLRGESSCTEQAKYVIGHDLC